jgi:hypothetical protein
MKIDGAPRKREPTLESAVWQATSRKAREMAHPAVYLPRQSKTRWPSAADQRCYVNHPVDS